MGHQKPQDLNSIVAPIRGGTGSARLAPPWSRSQVRWLGRGYFILRVAMDETSRWLLGGGFRWLDVFPHERTFRRSAVDKSEAIANFKMNPWPVHLAAELNPKKWREDLSALVEGKRAELDTGHVTLWRVPSLSRDFRLAGQFLVLDGHHSRRAQRFLGLRRMFGWIEPLEAPQLQVRAIERAGWLSKWLDDSVATGELKAISTPPDSKTWSMAGEAAFEVIQANRRWWCEIPGKGENEAVIDALARLAKGQVFLKSSANYDEIMGWLERSEIDTGIRLPPPDKKYVMTRALTRKLFPQKTTYFYPKLPFGVLVEDLS